MAKVVSNSRNEIYQTVQFNRHLKFKAWVKAWVKDEVKDGFRKALDRGMVKAWVKVVQKCLLNRPPGPRL